MSIVDGVWQVAHKNVEYAIRDKVTRNLVVINGLTYWDNPGFISDWATKPGRSGKYELVLYLKVEHNVTSLVKDEVTDG